MPTRSRSVTLGLPALAIHGGAGNPPARATAGFVERETAGLHRSLEAGWAVLDAGGSALDAAVAAVVSMEDSGIFNSGRGAVPTSAGAVETDAAVMGLVRDGDGDGDGDGWREVAGAACAMTWPANPVRVARAVAVVGDAVLLAGPGADLFAREAGLPQRDEATLTHGRSSISSTMGGPPAGTSEVGTVGAVAVDAGGRLGAATSTGGRRGQPPGRVGDAPVLGAGTWAEEGGAAVSATGDGEAFIRAGFAHRIDAAVRAGTGLAEAAADALLAVERWRGTGGAIAVSPTGELVVLCDTTAMARGWRHAGGAWADVLGPGDPA